MIFGYCYGISIILIEKCDYCNNIDFFKCATKTFEGTKCATSQKKLITTGLVNSNGNESKSGCQKTWTTGNNIQKFAKYSVRMQM